VATARYNIFWDCKFYEDQRATMMDILSENRKKKEYPNSVTELVRLEKKDLFKASVTS
jgi:protein associated with RNAse G/E